MFFGARAFFLLQLHSRSAASPRAAAALAAQGARQFSDMVDRASLNPRGGRLHALLLSCRCSRLVLTPRDCPQMSA